MTWYAAAEYCNWLSAREGIPSDQWCYEPDAKNGYDEGMRMKVGHLGLTGYRLPTEVEWEYACRSGASTARYFGRGEGLLPRYGWFTKNSDEHAWPVGQLRPNERGLFDTLGNVWEWVQDSYERSGKKMRILRGASFYNLARDLRVSNRLWALPETDHRNMGVRCAGY